MKVVRYSPEYSNEWDDFVNKSTNPQFIFKRAFIEYHKSKFEDFSLLFFNNERLTAIIPGCKIPGDNTLYLHKGLPFSDILMEPNNKWYIIEKVIKDLLEYVTEENIHRIEFQICPQYYRKEPSEACLYFIRNNGFVLHAQKLTSIIPLKLDFTQKIRKTTLNKLTNLHATIFNDTDYLAFYNFLKENLKEKYNAYPLHTYEELIFLKKIFSDQIELITVRIEDKIVGAILLFKYEKVIKAQYIISSVPNVTYLLIKKIVERFNDSHEFMDLGTSNSLSNNEINYGNLDFKINNNGKAVCIEKYIKLI